MTDLPNPFDSGTSSCMPDEAAASLRRESDAAAEYDCLMDDIGEIFAGARKLVDPDARFVLNIEQFMLDIEEMPLFLRQAV